MFWEKYETLSIEQVPTQEVATWTTWFVRPDRDNVRTVCGISRGSSIRLGSKELFAWAPKSYWKSSHQSHISSFFHMEKTGREFLGIGHSEHEWVTLGVVNSSEMTTIDVGMTRKHSPASSNDFGKDLLLAMSSSKPLRSWKICEKCNTGGNSSFNLNARATMAGGGPTQWVPNG